MGNSRITSEEGLMALQKMRNICEALPEYVEAVDKFGHTSFRVKDKPFIMMGEGESGASLSIKTDLTVQDQLLQQKYFYKTPYIGRHGWISIKVADPVDWKIIEHLVVDIYTKLAS